MRVLAAAMLSLVLEAQPALAQEAGWLERFNRAMLDVNQSARKHLVGLSGQLPTLPCLPADIRAGARARGSGVLRSIDIYRQAMMAAAMEMAAL
jgi:hypothetical protein